MRFECRKPKTEELIFIQGAKVNGKIGILGGTLSFNSKPKVCLVDKLLQVGIFQTEFVKCIIDGLSVNRRYKSLALAQVKIAMPKQIKT